MIQAFLVGRSKGRHMAWLGIACLPALAILVLSVSVLFRVWGGRLRKMRLADAIGWRGSGMTLNKPKFGPTAGTGVMIGMRLRVDKR